MKIVNNEKLLVMETVDMMYEMIVLGLKWEFLLKKSIQ